MELDLDEKKEQVLRAWIDLLSIVENQIAAVKAGQAVLRGSMLQELNKFLVQSGLIIEKLEKAKAEAERKAEEVQDFDEKGYQESLLAEAERKAEEEAEAQRRDDEFSESLLTGPVSQEW